MIVVDLKHVGTTAWLSCVFTVIMNTHYNEINIMNTHYNEMNILNTHCYNEYILCIHCYNIFPDRY